MEEHKRERRLFGRCNRYNTIKGYGHLHSDIGTVYVHHSNLICSGEFPLLRQGERVKFTLSNTNRSNRSALNVRSHNERPLPGASGKEAQYFTQERKKFFQRKFFPWLPREKQLRIEIDEVSLYSTTSQEQAEEHTKWILNKFDIRTEQAKNMDILDATACVGGNTESFSHYFKHVVACEIDENRASMLKNNLEVCGCSNVQVITGSFLTHIKESPVYDVVFIDPPWGGPNYKTSSQLRLFIDDIPLSSIVVDMIKSRYSRIALKLPLNFDLDELSRALEIEFQDNCEINRWINRESKILMVAIRFQLPNVNSSSIETKLISEKKDENLEANISKKRKIFQEENGHQLENQFPDAESIKRVKLECDSKDK